MKRKYLSALLMGTLVVASTSTFTSCKDYDDDISNLQGVAEEWVGECGTWINSRLLLNVLLF